MTKTLITHGLTHFVPNGDKKRQGIHLWLWAWLAVVFFSAKSAGAGIMAAGDIGTVLPASDTVCIGTVASASASGHKTFDTGVGYGSDFSAASAMVRFESVLSGKSPGGDFQILYPTSLSVPRVSSNYLPYPRIVVGERAIFFLKKRTRADGENTASFELASPFAQPSAVVPIGNASLSGVSSAATPFRRVVLTLTKALDVPDDAIRLDCLGRINNSLSTLVGFRDNIAGFHVDRQFNRQLRLALAEPDQAKLDDFVRSRVLPSVRILEDTPSPQVRTAALLTAGSLQDATAIPQLAALAAGPQAVSSDLAQEVSMVIAGYRTPSAVVPLILLLKESNLRAVAADALRDDADPSALPFLLNYLDDSDPKVVFNVLGAIAEATHQEDFLPKSDSSVAEKQSLVAYWKKWSLEHSGEIKKLRRQFELAR